MSLRCETSSTSHYSRYLYLRAGYASATRRRFDRRVCEMDVFWLDDRIIMRPDVDLQASEQGLGKDDLNCGFYIAQPTDRARKATCQVDTISKML